MHTYHRGHVDDRTAALTHHHGHTGMDEVESRLQVHCNHSIPLLLSHAQHQTILGDTGIVDEDIDRTKILLHSLHHFLCLSEVGSV